MSFRPTFSTDRRLVAATEAHRQRFAEVGFREVVAIVDVDDLHYRPRMAQVAELADAVAALPHVTAVQDPTRVTMFDRSGAPVPSSLRGAGVALLEGDAYHELVDDMLASRQLRRSVISDDGRQVAVTATVDLAEDDFDGRRAAVDHFTGTVERWSERTGLRAAVTGYPPVEQAYAREIIRNVLMVIAVLYVVMIGILYAYFRRWGDTLITLSGVTVAVPLVLAEMRLLGQPFSIVNSQVLTLVMIVGVAHAMHQVEEYRRRREAGLDHERANAAAFRSIAFASLMTGLTTVGGFLSLRTAGMPAVRSFGLSSAAGVLTVYVMNWLLVPLLVSAVRRETAAAPNAVTRRIAALLDWAADAVDRRPGRVLAGFTMSLVVLAAVGIPRVSVNQKVNEELPPGHPALSNQQVYERNFGGFLGPELWVQWDDGDLAAHPGELAAFVNAVCALPEVRSVTSPLDLVPQPPLTHDDTDPCTRQAVPLTGLRLLGGAVPPNLQSLVDSVLGRPPGGDATIVIRIGDIGTAHTLPFVDRVERIARDTFGPDATATPVGQWWLAQNGINRLSVDIGFASISALLIILPITWLTVRDRRLSLAAVLPAVMPVVAALSFMGLAGIPLRIGTAMILAISLGLAADDTIYLSLQAKRRIAEGNDPASAMHATLRRTGRPCCYSSVVLIAGFLSMTASPLVALRDMGVVASFTMAYALATDLLLGPAVYRLTLRAQARSTERGAVAWAPST
jgi:uncharacterized protein